MVQKHDMETKFTKPIIAITVGDPCGIGPEIILKALSTGEPQGICHPFVVGNSHALVQTAEHLNLSASIRRCATLQALSFDSKEIEVFDPSGETFPPLSWGEPDSQHAKLSQEAVHRAAELCLSGRAAAMVTAPINKSALQKIGSPFPGHTELLASLTASKEFGMMLVGGTLKIMLTTIHEPIARVPSLLTVDKVVTSIRLTHQTLQTWFDYARPSIGVAALNPHGGEEGMFGLEEKAILLPAVEIAQKAGIHALGPFPADSLFRRLHRREFDAAVALYHDQALIPLKLLAFGKGVNVSVGLSIIRTSVDHGTAYDIAGKGVADPGSLIEAIRLASQMAKAAKGSKRQVKAEAEVKGQISSR